MCRIKIQIIVYICSLCLIRASEIPGCDYFDTVDLTDSKRLESGAYVYDGTVIPIEQTGTYNYKVLFEGTHTSVPEHTRGCVCKFKACIRYCCHRHRFDLKDERKCVEELGNSQVIVTLSDGTQIERNLSDQFVVQQGIRIVCDKPHHMVPFTKNKDWQLFENGTLYRPDDAQYLSKRDYCIQPKELAALGQNFKLLPMNCKKDQSSIYVNMASICVLLLTTSVYIFVLKLQHIHDKCYLCYLISLSVSLVVNIVTSAETFLFGPSCYLAAYLGYFSSISIYLWLAVMAYDLWQKLVVHMFEVISNNSKLRFRFYSLFVWGAAALLLSITILADSLLDSRKVDTNWKMGYLYYECYAKLTDWSGIVYFFAPVALMFAFNLTLVIITAAHIIRENRKNREQLKLFGKHNIKTNIRFTIYLRFFTIAIMDWLIELTAVVANLTGNLPAFVHNIMFYLGLVQCILIFAVTVSRRDVIQLLKRTQLGKQSAETATSSSGLTVQQK